MEEEANPHLGTSSFEVTVQSEPPFEANTVQLSRYGRKHKGSWDFFKACCNEQPLNLNELLLEIINSGIDALYLLF